MTPTPRATQTQTGVPLEPSVDGSATAGTKPLAQASSDSADGFTGNGVSGVHTGVAAPTISAIPTPPTGGTRFDQLLLNQTLPDWSIWMDVKCWKALLANPSGGETIAPVDVPGGHASVVA